MRRDRFGDPVLGARVAMVTMMKLAAVAALAMLGSLRAQAVEVSAYTEEWPPYNYEHEGKVKGIATDILRATCVKAEVACEFALVPWARAYHMAQTRPGAVVYSTARKAAREAEFLWVGPILPRTTWIYGRPGLEKTVRTLSDLTTLRIGIVRGEASQQDLAAAGVPESALRLESTNDKVLRLLTTNLVDAMVDTEVGMAWNLRSAGLGAASVSRLLKLTDEGAYYYAFNLKTDPELIKKLQTALDKLRRDGHLDAIKREYAGH